MKPFQERIQDSFDTIKEVYPGLYNTAKDYREGRNILLNLIHIEANVDKSIIVKYLNDNTDLKYEIRRKR